ncbi:MAG: hypothetical protein OXC46_04465, partial [Thaumarchaeota archaeon]|nr:hypothetical protein [Nitrososphaerota archaeon]
MIDQRQIIPRLEDNYIWVLPQIRSLDGQKVPEFTGSIVPNETRMTSYYYASKPILKVPKNPKC